MSKHTEGPWIVRDDRFIDSPNRSKSLHAVGQVGIHGCRISKIDKANAKLIAAAPDLLEACISVKHFLEVCHRASIGRSQKLEMLEAAIKKASE